MARTVRLLLIIGLTLAGCQTAVPRSRRYAEGLANPLTLGATVAEHPPEDVDAGGDVGPSLSLLDAVRRAVAHDPRIQVALAKVRDARADAGQARLLPNPVLSLGARFREGGGTPIVEVGLAADLVAMLQRPRRISGADHTLRAAVVDVMTAALDAGAEAQEAYAEAQAADRELASVLDRQQRSARLVDMGRARLKAGEAAGLDVVLLETRQLEVEVERADKDAGRVETRLALARVVGVPGGGVDWDLEAAGPAEPADYPEAAWVDAALRERPEILSKRWELAALGDAAALAAWGPWEGGDVGAHSEYDAGWSVGPAVTTPLPLFDWGQAKRAKASAARLQARHEMTLVRRKVVEEVRAAHARFVASASTYRRAQADLLPLLEKRAAQTRVAYEAGEMDVATLLLAEDELETARAKVIDLGKKAAVASVKLLRAAGGSGPADPNGSRP